MSLFFAREATIEADLDHVNIINDRPPSFMINLTFERPVGAYADAKELEYITALHQTTDADDETFVDGSIEGKLFLELYTLHLDQSYLYYALMHCDLNTFPLPVSSFL